MALTELEQITQMQSWSCDNYQFSKEAPLLINLDHVWNQFKFRQGNMSIFLSILPYLSDSMKTDHNSLLSTSSEAK